MEIAICNNKVARYNIAKDSGSRIPQIIYISPSFFQTATSSGNYMAVSLEHTAVNLYCGITYRDKMRFISHTAVSKDITAVIIKKPRLTAVST